jgi:hypothetical protein
MYNDVTPDLVLAPTLSCGPVRISIVRDYNVLDPDQVAYFKSTLSGSFERLSDMPDAMFASLTGDMRPGASSKLQLDDAFIGRVHQRMLDISEQAVNSAITGDTASADTVDFIEPVRLGQFVVTIRLFDRLVWDETLTDDDDFDDYSSYHRISNESNEFTGAKSIRKRSAYVFAIRVDAYSKADAGVTDNSVQPLASFSRVDCVETSFGLSETFWDRRGNMIGTLAFSCGARSTHGHRSAVGHLVSRITDGYKKTRARNRSFFGSNDHLFRIDEECLSDTHVPRVLVDEFHFLEAEILSPLGLLVDPNGSFNVYASAATDAIFELTDSLITEFKIARRKIDASVILRVSNLFFTIEGQNHSSARARSYGLHHGKVIGTWSDYAISCLHNVGFQDFERRMTDLLALRGWKTIAYCSALVIEHVGFNYSYDVDSSG